MKRAVLVMMDGLRADQAYGLDLPNIGRMRARGATFMSHRGIFPSATRASSASVATGCYPTRHGLHGNQMGLPEGSGFVAYDVGKPEFFDRLRAATGQTLLVPTLAERVKAIGGGIVFSNVSPGAALAHDPDGHGYVYHRAVSMAPGRLPATDPLVVTLSGEGDAAMAERFVQEVLFQRKPASAVLWLSNPDDTQHFNPLGSPASIAAIREADRVLGTVIDAVEVLDPTGETMLLLAGSDHGHETVRSYIPVEAELIAAGFKPDADDQSLVIASQGTGFLVYSKPGQEARIAELADWLETRDWCGRVVSEDGLASIGHIAGTGVVLAVGMRSTDEKNAFGVPGTTFVASRFETAGRTLMNGSHGGMGRYETSPYLVAMGPGFAAGETRADHTALVDIAPTMLAHLDLDASALDGRPLQSILHSAS
ncbi:Type I phosphodiesterase/nucleotide pyrophosphatase/phosphate transferase [Rhabdaerophilaceae bacterium]